MRRGREELVTLANTIRVLACESVFKRVTAQRGRQRGVGNFGRACRRFRSDLGRLGS
jgi:hypothetical protein